MSEAIPPDPASDRGRARACGLALLEASSSYEAFELSAEDVDAATVLAMIGVARGHLRAAYLLADAGLELEAIGVRRTLIEYVLIVNWLISDRETNLKIWRWDDGRTRLSIDEDASVHPGEIIEADYREELKQTKAAIEAEFNAKKIPLGVPAMKTLAAGAMPYIYVAYRFDSQFTHPSTIAAQNLMTRQPDGHIRLHAQLPPAEAHVDTYSVGAWLLLGLLATIDQVLETPTVEPGRLDAIYAELDSMRAKP